MSEWPTAGLQVRFHAHMDDFEPAQWDRLRPSPQPFLAHAFLAGLERSGCIRADWGWVPHHLGLYHGSDLVAAAPLYLKTNSHGEFVFDWAWAEAWQRAGGDYYPKLLNAVPYSPVPGPRLLAGSGADTAWLEQQLVAAMQAEVERLQLASLHANFISPSQLAAYAAPWLARSDVQYHWHNQGWTDFEAFLAALTQKKRKNIRQERRRVAATGLSLEWRNGAQFSAKEWARLHVLYQHTFAEKGNHAALTPAMFQRFGAELAPWVQVACARREGEIIAMALFLQGPDTLYGRYWGAADSDFPLPSEANPNHAGSTDTLSYVHFELCYYQGIEYCIRQGLAHFEPGAQGRRHKLARGFMPSLTYSRHYLPHPGFHRAVAAALQAEAAEQAQQLHDLAAHSPYLSADENPS